MRGWSLLVLILLVAPVGAAQTPGTLALYPHFESSAGRWLSVIADEPEATPTSSGGNPLIHPLGPASGYMPLEYWWLYPYRPAAGSTPGIEIDISRNIDVQLEVIVYLTYGTTAPTPALVDVSWELRSGSGLVASGAAKTIGPTPGTTPAKLTWSEAPQVANVEDGTTLQLYVLMEGPAANYWMVTEDAEASYVHIPILEAAAPDTEPMVINETLSDALPVVEHNFTSATNDTYRFNWTTELAEFAWHFNATVGSGNATLALIDGNGTLVAEALVESNATGTLAAAPGSATAANWTLEVRYGGFVGSMRLEARQNVAGGTEPDGTGHGPGATGSGETAGNGTDVQGTDPKDTPGMFVALPVLLALLARRRRD